jgi:hypothetical protein
MELYPIGKSPCYAKVEFVELRDNIIPFYTQPAVIITSRLIKVCSNSIGRQRCISFIKRASSFTLSKAVVKSNDITWL